jgi:ABC-type antimicrobial peptide transport system permease subunit
MRWLASEHFRTAVVSLKRSRTRTLLTMVGVAIGVASITTILALSAGVSNILSKQVQDLGGNVAVIRPAERTISFSDFGNAMPQTAYTTSPITERDLSLIQENALVEKAAPLMTLGGSVHSKTHTPSRVTIIATTPDFVAITPLSFADGQFMDGSTLENTAVLGNQLAIDLFGTDQAMGKTFSIRGQSFTVIGVLKRQNNPVNINNIDYDQSVMISFTSGKLFNNGAAQIQQIDVKAKPGVQNTKLRDELQKLLTRNHDNQTDTQTLIGDDISRSSNAFFRIINIVMSAIAGISLLVGGIGIMNIMLVSVAERTREIGLRKAVGASNQMIVAQFMIEALIISILGGVLGYIGGYVVAYAISMFLPYDPTFSWFIVGAAAVLSIGVGVLFGLYPAVRAARKDPIESLRRLH